MRRALNAARFSWKFSFISVLISAPLLIDLREHEIVAISIYAHNFLAMICSTFCLVCIFRMEDADRFHVCEVKRESILDSNLFRAHFRIGAISRCFRLISSIYSKYEKMSMLIMHEKKTKLLSSLSKQKKTLYSKNEAHRKQIKQNYTANQRAQPTAVSLRMVLLVTYFLTFHWRSCNSKNEPNEMPIWMGWRESGGVGRRRWNGGKSKKRILVLFSLLTRAPFSILVGNCVARA